ncbi:MAG: complex I subunit 5 family protein [Thermodesulfobacteriota bacterium]
MMDEGVLTLPQFLFFCLGPGLPLLIGCTLLFPPLRAAAFRLLPLAPLPALLVALSAPLDSGLAVPWFFMGGMIGLDEPGRIFLLFAALLWGAAALFSVGHLAADGERHRYAGCFLAAMSGNFGLILARDFLGFYLFFSLMTFAAYGLIVHRESRAALRAGTVYLLLAVVGEVMLFAALLLLAHGSGSSSFADIRAADAGNLLFILLFFGFGIKAGALPLHFWLPLAHPVAPAPASAVLSGAMIKAGLLGWLRFLPHGAPTAPFWGEIFMVSGLAAVLYGIITGLTRQDAKTVLAWSSISQMGAMTMLVGCGLTAAGHWRAAGEAAAFYALHHGLAKGALFLGAALASATGMGGKEKWLLRIGIWLPCLALAGLPGTSGAIAKAGLKEILMQTPGGLAGVVVLLLPLAAAGTMLLMVHFVDCCDRVALRRHRIGGMERLAWVMLVVAALVLIWLTPAGMKRGVDSLATLAAVGAGLGPVLFGAGGGLLLVRLKNRRQSRAKAAGREEMTSVEGGWWDRQGERLLLAGPALARMTEQHRRRIMSVAGGTVVRLGAAGNRSRAEKVLQRWLVAGTLVVALFFLFYWAMASGAGGR